MTVSEESEGLADVGINDKWVYCESLPKEEVTFER